jgi:hypothetical protein
MDEVEIERTISAELREGVDPRVTAMAAALAAEYPTAARAVLFYGSCLRDRQLDGLILDFYLIVSDYRAAFGNSWLAPANRLVPPNVFTFAHDGLVGKYAVLSEADFSRDCGPDAFSTSVYARFAQPARLIWVADEAARRRADGAVASAVVTLLHLTRPSMADAEAADGLAVWRQAFAFTYGAELRAERSTRPGAIVDAEPDRYRRLAEAAGVTEPIGDDEGRRRRTRTAWRWRQRRGKTISVLRLMKASFTFAGGIDYLAWKINRHAGTDIKLKPWQRRWPWIAALILLPRLLVRGAVR